MGSREGSSEGSREGSPVKHAVQRTEARLWRNEAALLRQLRSSHTLFLSLSLFTPPSLQQFREIIHKLAAAHP